MKKLFYLLFVVSAQNLAQEKIFFNNDTINQIDSNYKKLGFWKIYDLKRNIIVSGLVKNNEKFEDANYFIDGKLFVTQKQDSILIFCKDNQRIKAKLVWQNKKKTIIKENGDPINKEIINQYFKAAELPAMFYGGSIAIAKFIQNNITSKFNTKGRVVVEVIINKDGNVEQPIIVSSENYLLDTEAISIIKKMPRWQPGIQQGYFIRTKIIIPITF